MQGKGIHHITAIAGDPQRNLEFYTQTLGLRLVKKTVNFDDPATYHFYFGDENGSPGTILTFFPWADVPRGRVGIGEVQEVTFRVAEHSLGYWAHRFVEKGVFHQKPETRFDEMRLPFKDPDGLKLALAALPEIDGEPAWSRGSVEGAHAIRGFHSAGILLADAAPTAAILRDIFEFDEIRREGPLIRLRTGGRGAGTIVELHGAGDFLQGQMGAGTVHHIAFRAPDDAAQSVMVAKLAEKHNIATTGQKDRQYFRSVYFREPGGVLFEIATDIPGFAVDESASTLGQQLKLPPFLESRRPDIEAILPAVA